METTMMGYPRDEKGFALVLTLLVVLAIGALASGAVVVGSNQLLVSRYHERSGTLDSAAEAGVELARAMLNGDRTLYPEDGYRVLEDGVPVTDASGNEVPGVERSVYVGPSGVTSGQYGVFGSIVSVVRDGGGGVSIRRSQIFQESFAKYAYFTDIEPSNISFGGGDQIWGPVHTNDDLKIYASGATFHSEARTAGQVVGSSYGTFMRGYEEEVPPIPMPETAELDRLRVQAQAGNTHFISTTNGLAGEATTRIEFVALDLDGDGSTNGDDEGFIKVYQSNNPAWVVGKAPAGASDLRNSWNCGRPVSGVFRTAASTNSSNWENRVTNSTRRCYLGGADELNIPNGFQAVTPSASDPKGGASKPTGSWIQWTGAVDARVGPALIAAGMDPAQTTYLHPITRRLNPNFKGVIFVDGKVAISGRLRGRVTVAATSNIIFADDIQYVTDPGLGTCQDIMGVFSGTNVVVSNNTLNAAFQGGTSSTWYTYDDSGDEFFHGVVLALNNFTVENFDTGATSAQTCQGSPFGRGCMFLTGGIIQRTRGAVGTLYTSGVGTGYLKRYSYDACAATNPPPYFPTTGHFARGQYYEVDPSGFDIDQYFALLTPEP